MTSFKCFGGPLEINLDGLGVLEDNFIILGVHQTKKLKNHCTRRITKLLKFPY